jgi:hypothetical protein
VKKERFSIARVVDIEGPELPGQAVWHMLRSQLRVEAFGVNAWTSTEAGQTLIGEHDEVSDGGPKHEELYVVLSGSATFTLDGVAKAVPAGSLVFVKDPSVRRSAIADSVGTTVLAVGSRMGEPFVVSQWERSAEALRYWPGEEWDEAIRLLKIQLAETPNHAGTVYNLACAEACAGRPDDAFEHLTRALELRPAFLETAQNDPDLASIRDDPRFPRP